MHLYNLIKRTINKTMLFFIIAVFTVYSGSVMSAECVATPSPNPTEPLSGALQDLTRLTLSDFTYAGAFRYPTGDFGSSNMHASTGVMETVGDKIYVVGDVRDQGIAQFTLPELVISDNAEDLNVAGGPQQNFVPILDRAGTGNTDDIDYINGIEEYNGKLIVNAHKWYDGAADNTATTLVLSNASDLAGSSVTGYLEFPDGPKSAGWLEKIPEQWRSTLGGDYLTGFSEATSIKKRHSNGPSAHAFNMQDVLSASILSPEIPTERLLEFSLGEPLHEDRRNETGQNDLWTIETGAWFGVIIPNTRTYATFGHGTGFNSGIGYKITQDTGNLCAGYCSNDADDEYAYYWLWDVADLAAVKRGEKTASSIRPYEYGVFPAPFQGNGAKYIRGGSFDHDSGRLYLMLHKADETPNFDRPPITIAYDVIR